MRAAGVVAIRTQEATPLRTARRRCHVGAVAFFLAFVAPLATANPAPPVASGAAQSRQDTSPLSMPARSWTLDCANAEILVIQHPDSFLRYRYHVVDEKGDQTRDQIETPDGTVGRLILRDGKPITAEEDADERDRLRFLLANPSSFAHHIKNEQANKKLGIDLLRLMPDAMLWSYAPGQPQLPSPPGAPHLAAPLVVLDFKPNPQWSPPNLPAEALTGLEGRLWIDPGSHRMVRLEGDLVRPVNIGWGMVAHLYPGGTVTMSQVGVPTGNASQRWIVDHVVEQLTVRALLVKTIRQRLVFDTAGFQPVPPMPYQQAIKILLDTPLPTQ